MKAVRRGALVSGPRHSSSTVGEEAATHLHEPQSPEFCGAFAEHAASESVIVDLVARAALPQHFKPAARQATPDEPRPLVVTQASSLKAGHRT